MILISNKYTWSLLYIFLIYYILKQKNKYAYIQILLCLLTVIIADFTTSSIIKPFFERLRPCHDNNVKELIHIVGSCKGLYGLASSHASTTFSNLSLFSELTLSCSELSINSKSFGKLSQRLKHLLQP